MEGKGKEGKGKEGKGIKQTNTLFRHGIVV